MRELTHRVVPVYAVHPVNVVPAQVQPAGRTVQSQNVMQQHAVMATRSVPSRPRLRYAVRAIASRGLGPAARHT